MPDTNKLNYNPASGQFTWATAGRGIRAGAIAGSMTAQGYWQIKLNKKIYSAHRLAWFVTHGVWPIGEVDHINGKPLDNRISNLRVVDRAGNSQNQLRAHADNLSCGLLGVTWNKQHKKWQSKIQVNKTRIHVGYFDDPSIAHKAYLKKKAELHISTGDCH